MVTFIYFGGRVGLSHVWWHVYIWHTSLAELGKVGHSFGFEKPHWTLAFLFGWFGVVSVYLIFFSEILSFKARLAFVWYPKFWAETVEWRVPILVEHSAFKIYLLLLRRFPTVTHLTVIQICWYQYHRCTSHNEASVIVLAEFTPFTHTLLNVSSFTM